MDRHISSSLGVPMTIQDSDITTVLNPATGGSRHDATLSLHVKLSYLFTSILTCKRLNPDYLLPIANITVI